MIAAAQIRSKGQSVIQPAHMHALKSVSYSGHLLVYHCRYHSKQPSRRGDHTLSIIA